MGAGNLGKKSSGPGDRNALHAPTTPNFTPPHPKTPEKAHKAIPDTPQHPPRPQPLDLVPSGFARNITFC